MRTIIVPDELTNDTSSIIFFDYINPQEVSKQYILLNKNLFSFLQEGTKEVYFNHSSDIIDPQKFLLIKSGNCLMTERLSNKSNRYRNILFFFSDEEVLQFIRKFHIENKCTHSQSSTYSFKYDDFIKSFVNSLIDISKLSKSTQNKLLATKFEEIMLYLIELYGVDFLHSLMKNNDTQSQKFIQTIHYNQLNKLTIKELSFLLNMSESTFKREFEKHFNTSPSKWFQEKRLQHAAYLLKNKLKRPSEIYEEIGYKNLSNFVQAFKSKFGLTPKQYQGS